VVIGDLYFVCTCVLPGEADAVFVVDADRVLTGAVVGEGFETRTGRLKVVERVGRVKHSEFAKRDSFDVIEPTRPLTVEDFLGILVCEALDHILILSRDT
jgi:hypothetical protein